MSKYIILGKAASGKNWLQDELVKIGYSPLKLYTTRPVRPNENGDEYYFVNDYDMDRLVESNCFISVREFNGWRYAVGFNDFMSCDVAILSPGALRDVSMFFVEHGNLPFDCKIVYLDIPESIRRDRLSKRYTGGNVDDSIERRIDADNKDFVLFELYGSKDVVISNNDDLLEFINKAIPQNGNYIKF